MAPSSAAATDYYRAVAPLLMAHLAGRPVVPLPIQCDWTAASAQGSSAAVRGPATEQELLRAVDGDTVGFLAATDGLIVFHLVPGDGADIATAATAALALAEQLAADGLTAVPLTDGGDGLLLMARTVGDRAAAAERYAAVLTAAAPELATTDATQADGRTLIDGGLCGPHAAAPVPYSLLPGADGPQAVIPLHLDEIAAITAGMPSELTAADVAGRLRSRGDLATTLLNRPTA